MWPFAFVGLIAHAGNDIQTGAEEGVTELEVRLGNRLRPELSGIEVEQDYMRVSTALKECTADKPGRVTSGFSRIGPTDEKPIIRKSRTEPY